MKRFVVFLLIVSIIQFNIFSASAVSEASSWAQEDIKTAIDIGLVPADLQSGYKNACSREDFCRFVIALVEADMGSDILSVLSGREISLDKEAFSDTQKDEILAANALGIVNGVGNNKFQPDASITREQAATMLMRASNVLGYNPAGRAISFSDRDEFSEYAVKAIDFVAKAGVMNGVANNRFAPKDTYSREMACITMLRLYNKASGGDKSISEAVSSGASSSEDSIMSAEEIFKKCSPSVFCVTVYDSKGQAFATGSGFFIKSDGTLVTNFHVIEGAHSAKIKLSDGRMIAANKALAYDKENDLAVLKADISGVYPLPLGDSDGISSGQKVFAIGSPLGLENSISDGIVANPYREEIGGIQITAAISSGSSGGALFNEKGEVIGITFAGIDEGQNLNFAIPVNRLKELKLRAPMAFSDMMAEIDRYDYENRAGMFEDIYAEIEPNDTEDSGNIIYNGYSVSGRIDDGTMDVFSVTCNSAGTIKLYLASDSFFSTDLVFAIAPYGEADGDNIVYANGYMEDGNYYMLIEYPVKSAGEYEIYVTSKKSSFFLMPDIEYLFYYEFKPN